MHRAREVYAKGRNRKNCLGLGIVLDELVTQFKRIGTFVEMGTGQPKPRM